MKDILFAVSVWEKTYNPQEIDRTLSPHSCMNKFFGRQIYLAIDSNGDCSIRSLNVLQRLARKLFGSYREIHKKIVLSRIQKLDKAEL